jgi:hypothetical protein
MLTIYQKNPFLIFSLLFVAISCGALIFYDGTGDSGDSVLHYLYARESITHPENLLNHWAKPIFTLLAAPFAQLGFIGIKIFNVIATFFTCYLTFKSAQKLGLKNSILAPFFILLSPLVFILMFSGLTEPLFALLCAVGLYFTLNKSYTTAAILLSFIPFVRSEGLIIIGVFALYFLIQKEFKAILFFGLGHLVYSLVGIFVYHDFFWIITQNPYQTSSHYGFGEWDHFVKQLPFIVGLPLFGLLIIGGMSLGIQIIQKKINLQLLLILGAFVAFFVAHTVFWRFGLFHSMGLTRVLIGVSPFFALIMLIGANTIESLIKQKLNARFIYVFYLLIAYVFIFPFTSNRAAIEPHKSMVKASDLKTIEAIRNRVVEKNLQVKRLVYTHTYCAMAFDFDHFDTLKSMPLLASNSAKLKKGDLVIWDNWFSVVEGGITKQFLTDLKLEVIYQRKWKIDGRKFEIIGCFKK